MYIYDMIFSLLCQAVFMHSCLRMNIYRFLCHSASGEEDAERHIFLVILFTLWLILYISFCFISLLVCFLSLSSFLVRHFFLMSLPRLSSRWFSPILPFPRLSVGLHRPSLCLSLSSGSPSSQSLYVWLPQWHLLYTPLPAFGSGEDTTADPAEQCQARVCVHTHSHRYTVRTFHLHVHQTRVHHHASDFILFSLPLSFSDFNPLTYT